MQSLLIRFEKSLEDTQSVLQSLDALNAVRGSPALPAPLGSLMMGRPQVSQLMFQVGIINCYAALERLIVDIGETYVDALPSVCRSPAELPSEIAHWHLELSLQVLARRREKRWSSLVDVDRSLANLRSCLEPESLAYSLNSYVFRSHSANFRPDQIREFMRRLGIVVPSLSAGGRSPLEVWYESTGLPHVAAPDPESLLVYLADKRNEIAHGADSGLVLGLNSLQEIVELVRRYGRWLHSLATCALAELATRGQSPLCVIRRVFSRPVAGNGVIAGVERIHGTRKRLSISEGDLVAVGRVIEGGRPQIELVSRVRSVQVGRTPMKSWNIAVAAPQAGLWLDEAKADRRVWSIRPEYDALIG